MTRYTNVAPTKTDGVHEAEPLRKRRNVEGDGQGNAEHKQFKATGANAVSIGKGGVQEAVNESTKKSGSESFARKQTVKGTDARREASEKRRLKRKDQRHAETICFACRENGHAARDCTKALKAAAEDGQEVVTDKRVKLGKSLVGICYRCGSRKHNLSKCKAPTDPLTPLPFASCFVCSGTGHLASSCPKNQSKGVYPNGGCCKLCGETSHLAKDCTLRKQEVVSKIVFLGTGRDAGADEDDFHIFKRRNAEVDKSEKHEQRVKRQVNLKMGAHTGVVKSFARAPAASKAKVVHF